MSGMVKSSYYEPHIYFILSHNLIYIGETQNISVRRWSSHLDKSGSFNKKLDANISTIDKEFYLNNLNFYSFSCKDFLSEIQKSYCGYRIPTQAIEHKIHEILLTELPFGKEKKVISETIKTAPRNFYHWNEANIFATKCIDAVFETHFKKD